MNVKKTLGMIAFMAILISMSVTYTPTYATTRIDDIGNSVSVDTSYNSKGGETYATASGAKLGFGIGTGGLSVSSPISITKVETLSVTTSYNLNGQSITQSKSADIPQGGSSMASVSFDLAPSFVGPVTPSNPAPFWPCNIDSVTTTATATYQISIPIISFWSGPINTLEIPAGQISVTQYLP